MSGHKNPKPSQNLPPSSSNSSKASAQIGTNGYSGGSSKHHYPNPPDPTNPDPATLREQWRFAIKQYSKWYSHAWGTAILAGISFFALGWIIKGSNPLPSFQRDDSKASSEPPPPSSSDAAELRQAR